MPERKIYRTLPRWKQQELIRKQEDRNFVIFMSVAGFVLFGFVSIALYAFTSI